VRKSLKEMGDKVEAGEKEKIEAAIKELRGSHAGDDKDAIEAKTAALMPRPPASWRSVYRSSLGPPGAARGRRAAGRGQGEGR
jgi:molecular chaperone DnaK